MKACEGYIDKLLLSLDGELPRQQEQALQQHLNQCPGCRCLYQTWKNIDTGIADMEVEPPEGLVKSVMAEIQLEKEKNKPVYYLRRMKFTLAALAACLILVVAGKFAVPTTETDAATAAQVPETMALEPELNTVADTAWMPAYDGTATTETGEAVTMDEIPTDEAEEAPEDKAVQQANVASDALRRVLAALNQDGYRGDLVELLDMTEDDIYETFSGVETLLISSGDRVYQVAWEQFDAVEAEMHYGTVVSTDETGEWVYLWIG